MALRIASRRSAMILNAHIFFLRRTCSIQARNASAMAVPTSSQDQNLSHDAQVRKGNPSILHMKVLSFALEGSVPT